MKSKRRLSGVEGDRDRVTFLSFPTKKKGEGLLIRYCNFIK